MQVRANGTTLYTEVTGSGSPVVFVHGSWGDHHNWDAVVPQIAASRQAITYDRRGHSQSERSESHGSIHEDAADLAALIEALDLAPVHVVGNSFGAAISLHLASDRPDLIRSLFVHEPPLVGLLAGDRDAAPTVDSFRTRAAGVVERLEDGDMAGGAQRFVEEIAFGPGAWEQLPAQARETFTNNAATWLDEMRQPDALGFDLARLDGFDRPTLLSQGDQSDPMFAPIVDRLAKALPAATRRTFIGAGHVPHMSHTADYVQALLTFVAE